MLKSVFKVPCFTNDPLPFVTIMWVLLKVPETGFRIVRSLLPIVRLPFVSVKVPLMMVVPFKLTPLVLLMVRLFNALTLEGIKTLAEEPPNTKLEEAVVDRFVAVLAIAGPFKVSILAPTANMPLLSVNVPLTEMPLPNVVAALATRLLKVVKIVDGSTLAAFN